MAGTSDEVVHPEDLYRKGERERDKKVLTYLATGHPIEMDTLIELTSMPRSLVNYSLARLQNKGLVVGDGGHYVLADEYRY